MTDGEYWHGDCFLCQAYLKKAKIERQRADFEQWKQGLYFLDAVSVAIARGINGDRKAKYPERPYEAEREDREAAMHQALAQFELFAAVHNAEKKKVENGKQR